MTRRALIAPFLVVLLVSGGLYAFWEIQVRTEIQAASDSLAAIAAEAAAVRPAIVHESIQQPTDVEEWPYAILREDLLTLKRRHDVQAPIITVRMVDGKLTTIVTTNETSVFGQRWQMRPEIRQALLTGERASSRVYAQYDDLRIAGVAPIIDEDDKVVAAVIVQRPASDFAQRRVQSVLLAALAGLLASVLFVLARELSRRENTLLGHTRRMLNSQLWVRIGLAGGVSVVVAVGILTFLDHREARAEQLQQVKDSLLSAVELGVNLIDPADHVAVDAFEDASEAVESPAFKRLQLALRQIKEGAHLKSTVYTLSRDRENTEFIGMSAEEPFVGHINELRPTLKQSFEDQNSGTEGPYTNARNTWVSAWTPIRDSEGQVVGMLQADATVDSLLMDLRNRLLRRVLFALLGVGVAFALAAALARTIAQPIWELARVAGVIERGDYDIHLDIQRTDEVGQLATAVQNMARGLLERERMRDLFGKYMASQVVQQLFDGGEIALEGEPREITVLLSDIRGYTALTEELGATDVVALLNEYFSILANVVIEHEGVIDKYMGDAMLCWFGAPVPTQDHSTHAAQAAEEILNRLGGWNADRVARGLAPVATGVGIAEGKVVVGNIGSPKRLEYTAIGDAVNLASRLCSKAEEGEILITDGVRRAANPAGFTEVGRVPVKGVKEPVLIFSKTIPLIQPKESTD